MNQNREKAEALATALALLADVRNDHPAVASVLGQMVGQMGEMFQIAPTDVKVVPRRDGGPYMLVKYGGEEHKFTPADLEGPALHLAQTIVRLLSERGGHACTNCGECGKPRRMAN